MKTRYFGGAGLTEESRLFYQKSEVDAEMAAKDKVITTAIGFIDQTQIHGYENTLLPDEYDGLVDTVKPYRAGK